MKGRKPNSKSRILEETKGRSGRYTFTGKEVLVVNHKQGNTHLVCKCDCGKVVLVTPNNFFINKVGCDACKPFFASSYRERKKIEFEGETYLPTELANKLGVSKDVLLSRINAGIPLDLEKHMENGHKIGTLENIGQSVGVTRERIRQMKKEGYKAIKIADGWVMHPPTKRVLKSQKLKKMYQIIRIGNKTIGIYNQKDNIFMKHGVKKSKHIFKKMDAWGIDATIIDTILKPECKIIINEVEEKVAYQTTLETFKEKGRYLNYKDFGLQVFLPLDEWVKIKQ